nr:T9SS type A sorting domain-containing protein [Bacteroidota bacterium]
MRTRFLLSFLLLGSIWPTLAQRTSGITPHVVLPPQPTCFLAPAPIAGSYRFRLDSLLTALNKSQVPTGILYDRVFPLARLDVFGQRPAADTSRFAHFLQANQELWQASYTCTGLGSPTDIRTRAAAQQKSGIVPLGLLHYRFNLLDTLAVQHNLLSQPDGEGGALYDVAGRPQSPYLTRETLVAAALVESVPAGTIQFKLPTSLRFDNTGNAVQSLTLDFNDGTSPATLLPGGAGVYKSYATGGEYFIQLTAHFADGSSKVTYTSLQVTGQAAFSRNSDPNFQPIPTCNPAADERVPLTASIPYTDYEGNSYSGFGEVTTYFANCANRQLTKPVIMLDGIDFGGIEQRHGVVVYSDFLNYYDQGTPKRLGEELRATGHDMLILDFPDANGAEYIQRNAFVLIQLIQNVNADLRSRSSTPEPLTVIGPSMSGLVSRYALAYMEQKYNDVNDPATYHKPEWNHNTRLWISFDSPQLGANIPIGDQQWLNYYAQVFDVEAAKKNLENALDRPASREMLVHHYRSTSQTVSGDPAFRDRFQTELDNLGMPAQLRRIAVVNGSLTGVRQDWLNRPASGCDQAFSFESRTGTVRLFYLKFLTINPLSHRTLSRSEVNFSPDYGQSCATFHGTASYFGANGPTTSRYNTTQGRAGSIGYDTAPGSWRDTQATLAKEGTQTNAPVSGFFQNLFLGGLNGASITTEFFNVVGKHCFIPTVSALALTNPNRDLGQNLSGIDLVCSGETPFDSYFAPSQNEEHVTITSGNALYLKNEINGVTPVPVFTTAPPAMCPGSRATFSVAAECTRAGQPATTYTWTPGTGLTLVSGQGTATVVVEAVAGYTGTTTVQVVATRTGYAASAPVERRVVVTNGSLVITDLPVQRGSAPAPGPALPAGKPGSTNITCSQNINLIATGLNVVPPYTMVVTTYRPMGAGTHTYSISDGAFQVTVYDNDIRIQLSATSTCTGALITSNRYFVSGCAGRPAPAAYPNPADTELNLTAPETGDATVPRTAVLYNAQGREVRRNNQALESRLSTADLPEGLYYLMVTQQGQVTRSQIRVQH